jgi:hypothetical protein
MRIQLNLGPRLCQHQVGRDTEELPQTRGLLILDEAHIDIKSVKFSKRFS